MLKKAMSFFTDHKLSLLKLSYKILIQRNFYLLFIVVFRGYSSSKFFAVFKKLLTHTIQFFKLASRICGNSDEVS